MSGLNAEQLAAVECDDPRILVVAGAGTGKTRVLTSRASRLVNDGLAPSQIACVTFTRKAATELRGRLNGLIGERKARQIEIGTFHGLCASWIRRYLTSADPTVHGVELEQNFTVLAAADAELMTKQCCDLIGGVKPADLERHRYTWAQCQDPEFADRDLPTFRAWRAYHRRMLSNNSLDFDGILETFFRLLLTPRIVDIHCEQFKHILVDECQDTDSLQWSLVQVATELESLFPGCIFAVGDVRQSIYGWRGAQPQIIGKLVEDGRWTKFVLRTNYRSTDKIVALANRVDAAMDIARADEDALVAVKTGLAPDVIHASTYDDAWRQVADQIKQLISIGIPASDIAVLYRTHAVGRHAQDALDSAGVPTHRVGQNQDLLDSTPARQMIRMLRLVTNPSDDQAFEWLINWPRVIYSEAELVEIKGRSLSEMIPLLAAADERADHLREIVSGLDEHRSVEVDDGISRLSEIQFVLARVHELVNDQNDVLFELAIDELLRAAEPFDTIDEFVSWYATRSIQDELIQEHPDAVTLATVHAAKGLEWPVVFVVGLEESVFPIMRKDTDEAEELRLFYVAVTRAASSLTLVHSIHTERRGQISLATPSCFIAFAEDEGEQ